MQIQNSQHTNTRIEREALPSPSNLSDGHARLELDQTEREIINQSLEVFDSISTMGQERIEDRFLNSFFRKSAHIHKVDENTFLTYASSSAIKITAQALRIKEKRVFLIEPCFDNIFHILNTEGLSISPITEESLASPREALSGIGSDTAIWLVLPNNPTGFWMTEAMLEEVASHAQSRGATLVIDLCFKRFVVPGLNFDVYEVLHRTGVDFIALEDTGKTWSIGDLKVGITTCSSHYSGIMQRLHDELLLSVSPFVLSLLHRFIDYWESEFGLASFSRRMMRNSEILGELNEHDGICFIEASTQNVPMKLLQVRNETDLLSNWTMLRSRGVELLTTTNYFWSGAPDYLNAFRVPFLKPHNEVMRATEALATLVHEASCSND